MAKCKAKNTRMKKNYLDWLKDARGYTDASISKAAASISCYEAFLTGKDFKSFGSGQARTFKRQLSKQKNERTGAPLSRVTTNALLRDLKAFFKWLADQPGYKSKITHSDADYLTPDRKSENARRGELYKAHPTPKQARSVILGMPADTLIQRRNRALMALLFLTGSRISAAISLQIGAVDVPGRHVQFDGRLADTKFGKRFTTAYFPMGAALEQIVADWIAELEQDLKFSKGSPLFPKTRVAVGSNRRFEVVGLASEPWSASGSAAKIFKAAFADAGYPPYSPHLVRDTLTTLGEQLCKSMEEFKAWSQNTGHDKIMTTLKSYGTIPVGRQVELMQRFSLVDEED